MASIRIGISGWTYPPWRGKFYPKGLAHKRELEFASRQVNSIEINGTFYRLQKPDAFRKWHAETPEDFVFSIKANRYVTHIHRLREISEALANFFASGILELKAKLGPILWQLPPSFKFDEERLENFMAALPMDTENASRLARGHARWMNGRSGLRGHGSRKLRHALEVRHSSFDQPAFYALLKKYQIALVASHSSGEWPFFESLTSDFAYARLHGQGELYSGGYGNRALNEWAAKIRRWTTSGHDVYLYFDNEVKVRAPFDAMELLRRTTHFVPERDLGRLSQPRAA